MPSSRHSSQGCVALVLSQQGHQEGEREDTQFASPSSLQLLSRHCCTQSSTLKLVLLVTSMILNLSATS